MTMKHRVVLAVLLVLGCTGGRNDLDPNGLAGTDSPLHQFARASQLYWRGSLSAAREEFNGVIYRYPGSGLADDARLAVRRIESELREEGASSGEVSSQQAFRGLQISMVGTQDVSGIMEALARRLNERGGSVQLLYDPQAPEVTVVLYRQGQETPARTLADSLSLWLSRPSQVEHQGGGGLIDAVAPDCQGILVVVGADARLEN